MKLGTKQGLRLLALAGLLFCLALTGLRARAQAPEEGLCPHHPAHTEACGYQQGQEGSCQYAAQGCPYCLTQWTWAGSEELPRQTETGWTLALPGADSLSGEELAALLPPSVEGATGTGEAVSLALEWDLSTLPQPLEAGSYTLTAALADTPEGCALAPQAQPLTLILELGGAETYAGELTLPSGQAPLEDHIIQGISPLGTTINLFDYWLTGREDADTSDPKPLQQGINEGHALYFRVTGSGGGWNNWTNSANPHAGIVQSTLGEDGYPRLSANVQTNVNNVLSPAEESLAYLFDPDLEEEGKKSFENVQGLLQVDEDGYYYYDCKQNYAVYYEGTNSFTLYDLPGVKAGGGSGNGQFFPFTPAQEQVTTVNGQELVNDQSAKTGLVNHYFGLHMSTRFVQQYGGHVDKDGKEPVTYTFSGDDDVWIFIDGTLVADLGGIHDAASVEIDFSTGEILINGQKQSQTLGQLLGTGSDTLTDNTYHTLDFFYLERGNVDSNMTLRYNLVTVPESDLIKVDQLGEPVSGAAFALYGAADYEQNGENAFPVATGRTGADGRFVFERTDADGNVYSVTLDQLYQQYGQTQDSQGNNLILIETDTPAGYRPVGEVGLYFYKSAGGEVLLLSDNIWDKGAYAMPKVTVTAPNEIRLLNGDGSAGSTVTLTGPGAEADHILFGVVLQKQEDGS